MTKRCRQQLLLKVSEVELIQNQNGFFRFTEGAGITENSIKNSNGGLLICFFCDGKIVIEQVRVVKAAGQGVAKGGFTPTVITANIETANLLAGGV